MRQKSIHLDPYEKHEDILGATIGCLDTEAHPRYGEGAGLSTGRVWRASVSSGVRRASVDGMVKLGNSVSLFFFFGKKQNQWLYRGGEEGEGRGRGDFPLNEKVRTGREIRPRNLSGK